MPIPYPIITIPTSEPFFSTNMNEVTVGGTYNIHSGITSILVNGSSGGVSISGGEWDYQAHLLTGDNVFTILATDGVNYSTSDVITIIYNSSLDATIASTPTGISLVQGRNVVTLNVPFPNDLTNFQGFNFYGAENPGGGGTGYTLFNSIPINTVAFAQNNTVLVSETVTQVGVQQTTVTVENILTVDFAQYVHNRVVNPLGLNPLTTANYYVITTVFYDPINKYLIESPYSEELVGKPIVINTQLKQLDPRTVSDFSLAIMDQILAADPTADIKPGTVIRDTVVDPASTLFANLFTIINFIHVSQSFPTLIAFDDPNGTGVSSDVLTTPGKDALRQALLIPTSQANTVQTLIDTAFDKLAGNVNKTRNLATRSIGTITVYTTRTPTGPVSVQPGATIQTTADTVNGVASVQFQTLSGFLLQVADLPNYFNSVTNRYEFTLNIQAVTAGTSGNVNAGTITSVVNGFDSIFGVINGGPTEFGTNQEPNESLATRAQLAFLSVDSGTSAGYFSNTIGISGVTRAIVISAGNALMQRDLDPLREIHALGKVDIYVQGNVSQQVTETIGFAYDKVVGEQFYIQSRPLFQFKSVNPAVTASAPIFEVTQVLNVTRAAVYDLTGFSVFGDGNVIQLDPTLALNIFVGLGATDIISVTYVYRASPPIILSVQPVQSIISVTGNLSGVLTSANYTLAKQDDPLLLGNSTSARDKIIFNFANGVPTGGLNTVSNEVKTLTGTTLVSLTSLGVDTTTIVVTNQAQSVTYTLNNDYTLVPGSPTTQTQIARVATGAITSGQIVLVSYKAGETMQIVYSTNSLLSQVQQSIDTMKHITADVLVKGAQATLIDIEMTVALTVGADPTRVSQNIRDVIGNQMATSPLGRSVYQSDIVSLTERVEGVQYVVIPLTRMAKTNGTQVIRELLGDPAFTVYQSGAVTSYISTEALKEPTTVGGGPSNLFGGIFENDFALTMVTTDTGVALAAGSGYIRADGKIIISTLHGTNPNTQTYTVTYVVENETGSNDIIMTSIEYGAINSLQITFTQSNQTFQGF